MNDENSVPALRATINFDEHDMPLYDVGGGDFCLRKASIQFSGTEWERALKDNPARVVEPYEVFILSSDSEEMELRSILAIPNHEGSELPWAHQRRVDLVTAGKHCCAGRTRRGTLCQAVVKEAGQTCRWHRDPTSFGAGRA